MSNDVKLTDREYARRIVAEHFGYDVVEDVSDQCSEVEFVLMGIKAGRGQPQREAVEPVAWAPTSFRGEGYVYRRKEDAETLTGPATPLYDSRALKTTPAPEDTP